MERRFEYIAFLFSAQGLALPGQGGWGKIVLADNKSILQVSMTFGFDGWEMCGMYVDETGVIHVFYKKLDDIPVEAIRD